MTETRAVARLPHVDIEILHRQDPDDGAELLSITLRGTPDLPSAARLLEPLQLLGGGAAMWNPWLLWMQWAQPWAMWQRGPWSAMLDERRR